MRVPHLDLSQELEAEAVVDAQHHIQSSIVNTHILYSHITPNPIRSFDDVSPAKRTGQYNPNRTRPADEPGYHAYKPDVSNNNQRSTL
jgi:hypothetical protein